MLGLEHHLTGIVMVPVKIKDTALTQQVIVSLGMRERSHYRELGQIQVNLTQEVNQTLYVILGLVIQSQQDGTLNAYAIVMITLNTLLDVVRCVINGLIYIPGTCLCSQIQHLGVILDGMAYPFLLERSDCGKEFLLPLLVLGK